jgi:nucleotide-binding universal stress UspA family protein
MYANILLSTDGSDIARKGVEYGIALAKALNAKVTVITVTEPQPVDYGSGHASRWIPPQEEVDRFNARVMAEQIGIIAELCMFRMRTPPLRLSKQQRPEAAT